MTKNQPMTMTSTSSGKTVSLCFVSPKAYPLFNPDCEGVFGGAEVDLYLLSTELAKDQNFCVSFITADYGQADEETKGDIRIIRSLDFSQNALGGACRIWRALKIADADIYMIKTISVGVPLVRWFCRRYNRKFVYRTAHQDECDGTCLKQHPILGRMFIRALRQADIVFAQNQSDADNLKRLHGIDASAVGNAHSLPDTIETTDRDMILWVARSAAFKQPQVFLELAGRFPNEKFVMICQRAMGDSNYELLQEHAAEIPNMEFVRRVPFHEIDSYFRRAKVFVNTSRTEGFANTFIQACKWAVPVLTLAANPDGFLDRYDCGRCASGNTDKLVEALGFLLEDNRYLETGLRARHYAEQNHDITKIVNRYKKTFEELL